MSDPTEDDARRALAALEGLPEPEPDPENPEWTDEDFARARPAREVLSPEVLATFRAWRDGLTEPRMKRRLPVSLDPDVFEHFQAMGEDWEDRMNAVLRRAQDENVSAIAQPRRERA